MPGSISFSSDCEFIARSLRYLEAAAHAARTWYDVNGCWLGDTRPPSTRERYWIAFALYSQGALDFANAVVLGGEIPQSHMGRANSLSFDIFHTNIACLLLKMHRERMCAEVVQTLEDLVREGFGFDGNRRPDFHFRGYNDNMPAKASMGLILGGEMLNDPAAVEQGLWNLRGLRDILRRRGAISEWNSPTYSAATLHAIAEIAHYARHPEAREMAGGIEERIWLDLAARFHPEMGRLAGPHSRTYTADTVAHLSCVASLLWFVLGDISKPSPLVLFAPEDGLVFHNLNNLPFNIAQMTWFAAGSYHPPARALQMFASKSYPFRVAATAEMGDWGPGFPARPVRLESFLQSDYTVGTATSPWLNGIQSATYFVTYKRVPEVRSCADVGTVFHKFIVNDEEPGAIKFSLGPDGKPYANSGEQDNLDSLGNMVTLQSGPSVLALTHPHLALGRLEQDQKPLVLKRLSETVIFPSHFGGAEEIRVGSRARESWTGCVSRGEWIGCRRGRLFIAIRPLVYLAEPREVEITLEKINRYEVIRSTFYHGPEREFARAELRNVFGGFVAEHAGVDDYPSLAAFMEELAGARFTDYYWTTRRVRYRRPAGANRPALELETSWSPGSVVTRFALIDGQPVPWDDRVSIDGMADADFPFLTEPWESTPSYFPWPKMEANWGTGGAVGFIGDREQDGEVSSENDGDNP